MEQEFKSLDWKEGEERYIQKRIDYYLKKQSKMPLGFLLSKKKLNKNIEEIKKEAKDYFRFMKLYYYKEEIEQERERIDKLIEDTNNKINKYIKNIKENINNEIKPFKIKTKDYINNFNDYCVPKEIVSIYCEPFEISFIQEIIK